MRRFKVSSCFLLLFSCVVFLNLDFGTARSFLANYDTVGSAGVEYDAYATENQFQEAREILKNCWMKCTLKA
jgi:hypothetical protein